MVKQRAKAPNSKQGAKAADRLSDDAEIIKERMKWKAFEEADWFLSLSGWCLWAIALCLFCGHIPELEDGQRWSMILYLLGGGFLCGNLAAASPKGTWSRWRVYWHYGWMIWWDAIAVMSFFTYLIDSSIESLRLFGSKGNVFVIFLTSMPMAYLALSSAPGITPQSPDKSSWGWQGLLASHFYAGMSIVLVMVSAVELYQHMMSVQRGIGPCLCAVIVLGPPLLWSFASFLARTENEIVGVVSPGVLLLAALGVKYAALQIQSAIPFMLLCFIAHGLLYVNTSDDDDSGRNPFHASLRRKIKGFTSMLSDPVSGFGDDG